jgi:hypothetical protein
MKKLILGILVAMLVMVLLAPTALAKPDMSKPLPATDVQLVKKVTVEGKAGSGRGKPTTQAATGTLGANVSGNKYAIIIGISDYPGTANDLQYCDDDAQDMYDALTELYGYDPDNIRLLKNMEASFVAIQDAISDIRSKEVAGDEVVFFFSGHGTKGKADDGDKERIDEAIVSHDGNQYGDLIAIWDGQLRDWFAGFETQRIIFIFDSCLAGGMTDLQAPGRVINMACSESGVSYEDDSWQNGQFTYFFVDQGMLASKADKYDNLPDAPDVTIEEAFDYARANCQMQTPTISDSFPNDLLL